MTILQKIKFIREEHYHNLRSEKEREFIEDMYEGIDGVPLNTKDEDITEYLTPRQIQWIEDIWNCLPI